MSSFKAKLINGLIWRFCYYLSAFVLNVLISHNLGAAKSGIFYLLLNNLAFIVLFLSIGIDSAIGYFNARKEIKSNQLFTISILCCVASLLLVSIAYLLAVKWNVIEHQPDAAYYLVYIIASLLTAFLSALVFSMGNNKTPAVILTVTNIVLLFLLPINPLLQNVVDETLYTKLYLLFASLPALLFVLYVLQKRIFITSVLPPGKLMNQFLKFAFQSFVFTLLYTLLLRCDYWIVNYFCSDADLGNYLQTSKLNQLILLVPALISFTLFPLIVSQLHEEKMVEAKVVKLSSIYFYIGSAICIGIFSIGFWILPILYGQSFYKMYPLFLLLSPGMLLLAASYPFNAFFSGKNLIKINIKATIIAIIVMLVADFILIPRFGIYGAAIGSSLGYSLYFIYLLLIFKKNHPFKFVLMFNIIKLLKENRETLFTNQVSNED